MPGWVTVVSLCCFCNVALIFATMKTFILQQVKCCHLSPFLFKLNSVQNISSLDPLIDLFFSSLSFTCFLHHLLFISEITPDSISHVVIILRQSASVSQPSGDLWWDCWFFFFLWGEGEGGVEQRDLTSPSPFIFPDLCLLISVMGSQLLMKSQSVLWTVTWSWVEGFWPLVAAFL